LRSPALEQLKGVTIVKLLSQNFSQLVRFKLRLRHFSLSTLFPNGVGLQYIFICERV